MGGNARPNQRAGTTHPDQGTSFWKAVGYRSSKRACGKCEALLGYPESQASDVDKQRVEVSRCRSGHARSRAGPTAHSCNYQTLFSQGNRSQFAELSIMVRAFFDIRWPWRWNLRTSLLIEG